MTILISSLMGWSQNSLSFFNFRFICSPPFYAFIIPPKMVVVNINHNRRTFHSDQGWAYQMKTYSYRLKKERIFQSMSRKGNCHDNSVMESFFGLLKQEIYYGVVYYSYEELKSEIERYIKYYNEQRIKEKLGWMSPVQYRLSLLAA